MKLLFFLALCLTMSFSFAQTTVVTKQYGTLEFTELDHGIASKVEGTTEAAKTPSGTHGWLADFVITDVTDSIPLIHKKTFGVVYIMGAKDAMDVGVDIEWIYPQKIKNDKGEKFKSIRYSTRRPTNIPSASSYSLDQDYEMVKGKWVLNIYVEDKKVFSRAFILYEADDK